MPNTKSGKRKGITPYLRRKAGFQHPRPGRPKNLVPSAHLTLSIPEPDMTLLEDLHPRPATAIRLLLRKLHTTHRQLWKTLLSESTDRADLEQRGDAAMAKVKGLLASINSKSGKRK